MTAAIRPSGCFPYTIRKSLLCPVKLKNGAIEVLATSLLNEQTYPSTCFKHLYHLRWGVEEGYKREGSGEFLTDRVVDNIKRLQSTNSYSDPTYPLPVTDLPLPKKQDEAG